jgi:hypothetical protein
MLLSDLLVRITLLPGSIEFSALTINLEPRHVLLAYQPQARSTFLSNKSASATSQTNRLQIISKLHDNM